MAKRVAFLDCPTGISGDMCLGALVSAGVPLDYLQQGIAGLSLPEAPQLQAKTVTKNGIAATKVDVKFPPAHREDDHGHEEHHHHAHPPARHLPDIEAILTAATLPERAIANSLAIFRRLAIAEGAIHAIPPEQVHFHEVGATDAIVDIVGTCLGLDWLGIDTLYCSALPVGRGTVRAAHGRLPVPAPAVLQLLAMANVPIYNPALEGELVTPTGAAIATELASEFGDPPAMVLQTVGLGAGNRNLPLPNMLRLWVGTAAGDPDRQAFPALQRSVPSLNAQPEGDREARHGTETVTLLETQVDDLSPQAISYLYDRLFAVGALDVFTQSVTMKKSRSGHLITVITNPEQAEICESILLRETTTLGVRRHEQTRRRLRRQVVPLKTPLGTIRMKLAYLPEDNTPLKVHPEYEDCAAIAQTHHLPWREVHTLAMTQWQLQQITPVDES